MGDIIHLERKEVSEIIDELKTIHPDELMVLALKDGEFRIITSGSRSVTLHIGMLERLKFDMLLGSL